MEHALHLALFGEDYSLFVDRENSFEITRYRRARDPGSGYQGPTKPRPVKTAYRGYDWSDAGETYYYEDGGWVNCLDGSAWEGK